MGPNIPHGVLALIAAHCLKYRLVYEFKRTWRLETGRATGEVDEWEAEAQSPRARAFSPSLAKATVEATRKYASVRNEWNESEANDLRSLADAIEVVWSAT